MLVATVTSWTWNVRNDTRPDLPTAQYIRINRWRGRMGNHLFQYMAALGVARAHNMTYCGVPPHDLEPYFDLPVPHVPCPATTFRTVKEKGYATYQLPAKLVGNVSLDGYRQSWKYFESMDKPKIKSKFLDRAKQRIERMGLQPHEYIALHIRYGDKAKQSWFRFPPCSYFQSAKRLLGERLPLVVVAEPDAQDFARRFFDSCWVGGEVLLPGPVMEDFAVLALASGIVSTMASTFSWWAAYLSGAHFVYYVDEIVTYQRVNLWKFKSGDYYLPQWSKLNGLELQAELQVVKKRAGLYNPHALTKGIQGSPRGNFSRASLNARVVDSNFPACATFVTLCMRFPSKHSDRKYFDWLSKLALLDANLVLFGSMEVLRWFYHLRPLSLIERTAYYETKVEDLYMHQWYEAWSTRQHEMDKERDMHNWKLYEVWNEKIVFLEYAIRFNSFRCSHFYWIDAGYFRSGETVSIAAAGKPFPSPSFLKAHPKVSLLAVHNVSQETVRAVIKDYPSSVFAENSMDFIRGNLFGGKQEYLLQWNTLFLWAMLRFLEQGQFAGKDQNTMGNLAIKHQDIVEIWDGGASVCHERWFCMVDVLAERNNVRLAIPPYSG